MTAEHEHDWRREWDAASGSSADLRCACGAVKSVRAMTAEVPWQELVSNYYDAMRGGSIAKAHHAEVEIRGRLIEGEKAQKRAARLEEALRERVERWGERERELSMASWEYERGQSRAFETCADDLRALLQEGSDG